MKSLDEFVKKKRYLICVDSDGCAMDTMDVKLTAVSVPVW